MSGSGARAFVAALQRKHDGRYAQVPVHDAIDITAIRTNSAGAPEQATGTIADSDAIVTIATRGIPLSVGDRVLARRAGGDIVGPEYEFVRVLSSLNPGSGFEQVDANVPAPAFAAIPFTSVLYVSGGAILASGTVHWVPVPDSFGPSGYVVSWRPTGTSDWHDIRVAHIDGGANQLCQISTALLPASSVDVKIATFVNRSQKIGPANTPATFVVAGDTASPATLTSVDVNVGTPDLLTITPIASTIDPNLFLDWEYSIATSPSGTGATVYYAKGPLSYSLGTPGTSYYVAVRARAKNGAFGNRIPSTGTLWAGPYVHLVAAPLPDMTPPTVPGAPTLATFTNQPGGGGTVHGYLTITEPSYTPPADFREMQASIVCSDGRAWVERIPAGTTTITIEVGFGTFTVALRGVDTSDNASAYGPTANTTITAPAFDTTAPTVTTASVGAGVKVSWTVPTNAVAYELYRANDAIGTGEVLVGTVETAVFIDALIGTTLILPTYYYRVRAIGLSNGTALFGSYSTRVAGTVGAVDAQNLRLSSIVAGLIAANQITAAKLEADLILATKIRTATSGSRWELEGHTGTGTQDQFRAYENVGGTDKLRMLLTGLGLTLYDDTGAVAASMLRNAGGYGEITLRNLKLNETGMRVQLNVNDLYLDQAISGMGNWRVGYVKDSAGNDRMGIVVGTAGIPFLIGQDPGRGVGITATSYLELMGDSIGFNHPASAWSGVTLGLEASGRLLVGGALRASGIVAQGASLINYFPTYPVQMLQSTGLGTTGGNTQPLTAWQQYDSGSDYNTALLYAYRGQTASGKSDMRFRLDSYYSSNQEGGGIEWGWRGTNPVAGFIIAGVLFLFWDAGNNRWDTNGKDFHVGGALSKASGTFTIPHPDPGKSEEYDLRHSFVESPTAGDLLYRFAVYVRPEEVGTEVATLLPDYWLWLNENGQCWPAPVRHFGRAWAEVREDGRAFVLAADTPGWYNILVIGTRRDPLGVRGWEGGGGVEPRRAARPSGGNA